MFKYLLLLALPFSRIVCDKQQPSICEDNTALSSQLPELTLDNWQYYSEQDREFKLPASGVYEQTKDGLIIYGSGYRNGARLSTSDKYCLHNKTIFVKWKTGEDYYFSDYRVTLYYDKDAYAADESKRTDLINCTTANEWNNSVVIRANKWYYTKVTISNNSFTATTAENSYNSNIIQTKTGELLQNSGFLAVRHGDSYGAEQSSITVAEFYLK